MIVGPLAAGLVGFFSYLLIPRRRRTDVRIFNAVMGGLLGITGGSVLLAIGGQLATNRAVSPAKLLWETGAPLLVSVVAMLAMNAVLVGIMVAATTDYRLTHQIRRIIGGVWLQYIGYGLMAFLFAVLWKTASVGPASVLIMIVPLLLAQWIYSQQSAEAQAHQRTVEGLVAAVETRDPVMRGRSVQAAAVCDVIGADFRLAPKEADALHFAALLHDLGMIAPVEERGRDLSQLRPGDIERILRHPGRGVEMVRSIDFLADSTTAIRHHHERWDGHGFPSGLAGEDIPILARIIAVADAYCALSSDRPGGTARSTDEILTTLRARSGSQFDPRCVDAVVRNAQTVTARLSQLHVTADTADATAWRAGWDHDLPETSDLIAFGSAVR